MKEGYFEPRGISYRINEMRPGLALVFIHGLSGSISAWYEYEAKFGSRYTMLAIDLRGHGLSLRPKKFHAYHPQGLAEDVAALLAHLGIHEYVLITHSLGTLVGLELSLMRERHAPMIIMSPNYGIRAILTRRVFHPFLAICSALFNHSFRVRNPRFRTDYAHYKGTGDYNVRRIFADIRNTTLRVYIFCLVQVYAHNKDDAWKLINAPVHIIHGRHDKIIPVENARALSAIIPSAKITILEDSNHILVLNNVEEVSTIISTFIDTLVREMAFGVESSTVDMPESS